MQRRW